MKMAEEQFGYFHISPTVPGLSTVLSFKNFENRNSNLQIFVKTLNGSSVTMVVSLSDQVDKIKSIIQVKTGIPASEQIIIFEGKLLSPKRTLHSYNICDNSTLHLMGRLPGGMKPFLCGMTQEDLYADFVHNVDRNGNCRVKDRSGRVCGKRVMDHPANTKASQQHSNDKTPSSK